MAKQKAFVSIDGKKPIWVIKEDRKIINKNPVKEELKGLELEKYTDGRSKPRGKYKVGSICPRCIEYKDVTENSILCPGNACREKDKDGNETGEYICFKHWSRNYQRYDHNSTNNVIKSMANCRTGNISPDSENAKGDKCAKLACLEFEWIDLNKKNDNYCSPIDCYDPKTGLYHQVRGKLYEPKYRSWHLTSIEGEWTKKYRDMVFYCINEDGYRIERIYIIPLQEINIRKGITIYKNPSRGAQWYEKYRVTEEELKISNKIYQKINEEEN